MESEPIDDRRDQFEPVPGARILSAQCEEGETVPGRADFPRVSQPGYAGLRPEAVATQCRKTELGSFPFHNLSRSPGEAQLQAFFLESNRTSVSAQ